MFDERRACVNEIVTLVCQIAMVARNLVEDLPPDGAKGRGETLI